jgi:hypothetical protein
MPCRIDRPSLDTRKNPKDLAGFEQTLIQIERREQSRIVLLAISVVCGLVAWSEESPCKILQIAAPGLPLMVGAR